MSWAKTFGRVLPGSALAHVLVLAATVCSAPAWAGPPAGVQVVKYDWNPAKPDQPGKTIKVLDEPNLLSNAVQQGWTLAKPRLEGKFQQFLATPNLMSKNTNLYDINVQLGSSPDLTLDTSGNPIKLTLVLRGNSVAATSTTDTALGKWADPRFSFTFDVTLRMELPVPSATQPVLVNKAVATLSNVSKPDSHGVVADVISLMNDIVAFVGGPDFLRKAAESMNGRAFDITRQINEGGSLQGLPGSPGLKPMNKVLSVASQQGYHQMNGAFDTKSKKLILVVTHIPQTPSNGRGVVAGTIRWKKAYGHPKLGKLDAYAGALQISAAVQTAPKGGQSFDGPTRKVGRVETHMQAAGDSYECQYTIRDLPLGIPIRVDVALNRKVGWVAGSDTRSGYDDKFFRQVGGGGPVQAHRTDLAFDPALHARLVHASLLKLHPSAKPIPLLKTVQRQDAHLKLPVQKYDPRLLQRPAPAPRGVDFEMYLQDAVK
jgi:hypothetical protein